MIQTSASKMANCNGTTIEYTLAVEQLPAVTANGSVGTLSAFSYTATSRGGDAVDGRRPVLFLTNGGPGAASSFLHLSGIAPFRAVVPEDLHSGALGPYGIEPSPSSILDVADLVFIDAPRTGLGVIAEDADLSDAYSIEGDGRLFANAILHWVRTHNRWDSPKYFLGESYGTQRAAALASTTHGFDAIPLSGIILLGQAVNIQEIAERPGNIAGALANVPYKAAVAWYHGVGSTDHATPEAAIEAALEYAWGDLATAMFEGNRISPASLRSHAERLGAMIGIDADHLERSRLWINKTDFRAKVLANRGLTPGSNDGRYVLETADRAFGEQAIDATGTQLAPRYTAAINQLLDDELLMTNRPAYAGYDLRASASWEWLDSGSRMFMTMGKPSPFHTYPYAAHLSRWMKMVPQARLFVGTGMYDSLTTIGAAEHLLRQWDLPAERTEHHWYRGGHMMYSDPSSSFKLNSDLRAFLTSDTR